MPNLISFDAFVKKYNGKKVDFDGSYGGQCFDLFRQYVNDCLGFPQPYPAPAYPDRGRGAADLWQGFDKTPALYGYYTKIANTPDFVPQNGDVMIWNRHAGGGHGHVGIIISADLSSFVSFDQNWRALNVSEPTKHDYTNVYGVLRPKISTSEGNSTPEKIYTEAEMTQVREARDSNWNSYQECKLDKSAVEESLKKTRQEYDQFREEINRKLDLPTTSLPSDTLGAIERLLEVEDVKNGLEKQLAKIGESHEEEKRQLQKEIKKLRADITAQQKQNETLLVRLAALETQIQIRQKTSRFFSWINKLLGNASKN